MPLGYAAGALAIALLAVLGSWTIGYRRGESHAKSERALLASVMGDGGQVNEPGGAEPREADPPRTNSPDPGRGGATPAQSSGVRGPILVAGGFADTDPRTPRHNYLRLAAKLDEASARSAIAALGVRGIEAFAEVDPDTVRRKDGPLYSLMAARAIPSGQTESEAAKRFKQQVQAAGTAWKKDGGIWDFADAYWELYAPKGGG